MITHHPLSFAFLLFLLVKYELYCYNVKIPKIINTINKGGISLNQEQSKETELKACVMPDFKGDVTSLSRTQTEPIDLSELIAEAKRKQLLPNVFKESARTLYHANNIKVETTKLSHNERVIVEEHERLSPHLIFEIIRRDGLEEMQRPIKALIFSGIVAGIVISFSFYCLAVLSAMLPHDSSWTPIISKWGYTVGFIIVILGRMQLFTENTITTVIPIFKPFQWSKVLTVLSLWGVVFISNLVGTTIAANYLSIPSAIDPAISTQLLHIADHVSSFSASQNFLRGIPAGILIAAVVWMMPSSRSFSIFVIGLLTYFIALGDFTHVVVGSTEMAYAVIHGHASLFQYFFQFLIPTGLGNIFGGTAIFTILVYSQIKEELPLQHLHCENGRCE